MKKLFFTLLILFATVSMWQANAQTSPAFTNCPTNITVNVDPGLCTAVVSYTLGDIAVQYNDPPDAGGPYNAVLNSGQLSGTAFPVGVTAVQWEAADIVGADANSFCNFTVTVVDNEDPVIPAVTNITVTLDGTGNFTISQAAVEAAVAGNGASDNCGFGGTGFIRIQPTGAGNRTFTCADIGAPVLKNLRMRDDNGNVALPCWKHTIPLTYHLCLFGHLLFFLLILQK